jgi:Cft2 family RNA processing exonuclease
MSLSKLLDPILAPVRRRRELDAEEESEYSRWLREFETEVKVFVERVDALDFEEAEDRDRFYELVDRFEERVKYLRSRSVVSKTPNQAVVELDELSEVLEDTSSGIAVAVAHLDEPKNPFEAARRREKEEERRRRRVESVQRDVDEVIAYIERVTGAFDEDI